MAERWMRSYARSAEREGWGIFSTGGEFGPFEIQRDDEAGIFADDDAALVHVIDLAERGSKRAWDALAICALSQCLGGER